MIGSSNQHCQDGEGTMTEPIDADKPRDALDMNLDSPRPSGELGETPLMDAARWGHADAVRVLIESGADLNLMTQEAWTALHAACVGKHGTIIELLLTHKANPNVYSYHRRFDEQLGWHFTGTPLHVAAADGSVQVAELLLARGALVGESWDADRRTPIFYAAAYGRAAVIAVLCRHGASVNCREHRREHDVFLDNTPLHYAARNGHVDATKMLLSCGAEPRARESHSRHTALQMARAAKHSKVVNVLREHKK